MSSDATHPTQEQLEAAAFGWMEAEKAQAIREHAAGCARCGPLLAAEEAVSQRLAVLRENELPGDLVGDVLRRIEAESRKRRVRSSAAIGVTVALVLVVGLLAIWLFNRKPPPRRRGGRSILP